MPHLIYKLTFSTAVHFGSDDGGDHLSSVNMSFHSDSLFSALYLQAMKIGKQDELLSSVKSGSLCFSDALPWKGNRFYIPRPVGIFAQPTRDFDPSVRKIMKRVRFIPVDMLKPYLSGTFDPEQLLTEFGAAYYTTRVNIRDAEAPLPYQVGAFRFFDDCGLYIIVKTDNEKLMAELFDMLSVHGIGGKVSSGLGKFTYSTIKPDELFAKYLNNTSAAYSLLLSTALPEDDALESAMQHSHYTLVRRGGFTQSESSRPVKKHTVYAFGAGSTFAKPFLGSVRDVGMHMPHPVYRCLASCFMGVE